MTGPTERQGGAHVASSGDAVPVDELRALEPIFHRSVPGADRSVLEAIVEPGFFEVGASGKVYTRAFVLDVVARRYAVRTDPDDDAWTVEAFAAQPLAEGIVLVTYRLTFAGRVSRRATVWRRHESGWKAAYHQGTLVGTAGDRSVPSG